MPTLWQSFYSLLSCQCPPDLAVSWLPWGLTRPGTLAQMNSVDGLGEMGHLVILILHMHKHKLWAPQDAPFLSLQADLQRRVVSALLYLHCCPLLLTQPYL